MSRLRMLLLEEVCRADLVVSDARALSELLLLPGGFVTRRLGVAVFRPARQCGRRLLRRVFAFGGSWIHASVGWRLVRRDRLVGVGLRVRRA